MHFSAVDGLTTNISEFLMLSFIICVCVCSMVTTDHKDQKAKWNVMCLGCVLIRMEYVKDEDVVCCL